MFTLDNLDLIILLIACAATDLMTGKQASLITQKQSLKMMVPIKN
jgi:hypothetical protein